MRREHIEICVPFYFYIILNIKTMPKKHIFVPA